MKICWNDAGHMTKMAAMPIYGKNPSKIFSGTGGPISRKLEGQGHFLTLAPGHLHMKIKTCFSKKPLGYF